MDFANLKAQMRLMALISCKIVDNNPKGAINSENPPQLNSVQCVHQGRPASEKLKLGSTIEAGTYASGPEHQFVGAV